MFMIYLHTTLHTPDSNCSLATAIKGKDFGLTTCCFTFYRVNCPNKNFRYFEDVLPQGTLGHYIQWRKCRSHFRNSHGHITDIY